MPTLPHMMAWLQSKESTYIYIYVYIYIYNECFAT